MRTDESFVGVAAGICKARTARRLPPTGRCNAELPDATKATSSHTNGIGKATDTVLCTTQLWGRPRAGHRYAVMPAATPRTANYRHGATHAPPTTEPAQTQRRQRAYYPWADSTTHSTMTTTRKPGRPQEAAHGIRTTITSCKARWGSATRRNQQRTEACARRLGQRPLFKQGRHIDTIDCAPSRAPPARPAQLLMLLHPHRKTLLGHSWPTAMNYNPPQ